MVRIKEALQSAGLAVAGQDVLGQVVGAHGEEIRLLRQLVRDQRGGRRLDHDAQLRLPPVGDALPVQFRHDLPADPAAFLHFPERGDHREQDGDVAEGGGAVDGAQLRAEDLRPAQANADGAQAHGGIRLGRQIKIRDLLVRADVQRADDDRFSLHGGGHRPVGPKLLLLRRAVRGPQIEEFRAEQTDALSVAVADRVQILHRTDIAEDREPAAVHGHIGFPFHGPQEFPRHRLFLLLRLHGAHRFLVRIQNRLSGLPVHPAFAAAAACRERVPQAADRRNAHRAGQDGRVAVGGTAPHQKTQDLALVKLHRFRRRQVVGRQDHGPFQFDPPVGGSRQVPQDPPGHIADIRRPRAQIRVVGRHQKRGHPLAGLPDRVLRAALLRL